MPVVAQKQHVLVTQGGFSHLLLDFFQIGFADDVPFAVHVRVVESDDA